MAAVEAHRSPFHQLHGIGNETPQHLTQHWTETTSPELATPFDQQSYMPMSASQPPQRPPTGPPASSSVKKRKSTKPKPIGELRRVSSRPQLQGLPMADQIPPSPTTAADRRRSKLGYHRINVACGHCRRRKIRCLMPAPEEVTPQDAGRCSHCIRLKKVCEFHPVPESSGYEPKARRSGPPSASNPSSPSTSGAPGHLSQDEQERPEAHSQLPRTATRAGDEAPMDSGFNGVPLYHEQQHYPVPPPVITGNWQAEGFTSPTSYSARQSPQGYWSPTQSAHSGTYPQANIMTNMGTTSYNQQPFAPPSAAQTWPQQSRSMSIGHVDPAHQQYPYPAHTAYGQVQQLGHESRLPYPNQTPGQSNSSVQPAGAPVMAPAVGPPPQVAQPYSYQQQDWQRYQMAGAAPAASERAAYPYQTQHQTGYYPPPADRREEMHPSGGAAYPQQSMYYPPTTQR